MPIDLQTVQVIVGIVISALTILGTIFGWFGKLRRWISSLFRSGTPAGIIGVPKKTLILLPVSQQNALWWHMGSVGDQPAMQIVGDLNVTNISKYGVFVMGARLRKPRAVGHALVRAHDSNMYGTKHAFLKGGSAISASISLFSHQFTRRERSSWPMSPSLTTLGTNTG